MTRAKLRLLFLAVFLCVTCKLAMNAEPENSCHYDKLFVFGDSFSDLGEGYLDGNGPTAVFYFARYLGIDLLPANAAYSSGDSLDFAISGAGTGHSSGTILDGAQLGTGMHNQVDQFHRMVREGHLQFNPANTLFFIAGGLNDDKLQSKVTVENLIYVINILYLSGARNFTIALLPTAIPSFSGMGKRLNPLLFKLPAQLLSQLPNARITLSRWGLYFDEVMLHSERFGFTNTSEPCAGRAIFHENPTPCDSPETHFYYHEGHPSTGVHKIVGKNLYEELQNLCENHNPHLRPEWFPSKR